jgi:menaquinone-dependent protoporphyrinogen IX oxidase
VSTITGEDHSPIRFGKCTAKIKFFLTENIEMLRYKNTAFFFTCMSVTSDLNENEVPLYIDHQFNCSDKPKARFKIMESNHTAPYYLKHFLKLIPGIYPTGIAFF